MSVKKVLLVDDSRVARLMTRKAVATAHPDWVIEEAGTGEEAVEKAPGFAPDFIVLDVNMPGIDGLEAARLLKVSCPNSAITLLTANIQAPVRQQALDLGISFLNKPFREDELLAFLNGETVA